MFIFFTDDYKSVFKIGSLNCLFYEINKNLQLHLNTKSIQSEISDHHILESDIYHILESDIYGKGLGCSVSFICS